MDTSLAVVIPTYNAGPQFAQLLESLSSQTVRPRELVVIDSGSTDGTADRARRAGARVLTLPKWRFNHGRTRNQAIAVTRSDLIVLTVQDALPADPAWLATLCAPLWEDASIAASYGLQLAPASADPLSRVRSLLWQHSGQVAGVRCVTPPEAFWRLTPEERLRTARFDNVAACLRRRAWEQLPLQPLQYGEDLGWGVQAILRGWKLAYVPAAPVWHYHNRPVDYEFRRAFLDGLIRARLLRWPAPSMTPREALALCREARHPQLAARHARLHYPAEIYKHVYESELKQCDTYPDSVFVKLYRKSVEFTWALAATGQELYPDAALPEGLWPRAAAFATAVVIGLDLGLAAAQGQGLFWAALRRLIARGV